MTEKRDLIDRGKLLRDPYFQEGRYPESHLLRMAIKEQHTVDAVEVVRCKECKHWHKETGWCSQHSHFIGRDGMACHPSQSSEWKMFDADDFCSYGERRTNNEKDGG